MFYNLPPEIKKSLTDYVCFRYDNTSIAQCLKNTRGDLTVQTGYVINMLQGVGARMKIKENKALLNLVIGRKPLGNRIGIGNDNFLTVNLQKEG